MGTGSIWPLISAGPSEKRGFQTNSTTPELSALTELRSVQDKSDEGVLL